MKKIILLVMAMVFLASAVQAESLSPLSDEELLTLYQQVSSELSIRNLSSAIDPSAADIQLRLYQFYQFWSQNDIRNMLSFCSPKWVTEQGDAMQSLFTVIRNRTAQSIEIVSVSGAPEDTVREVVFNTLIDKNNDREPMMYTVHVTMVEEDDGTWYIDPASMMTNEMQNEFPAPELTPVPEGTAASITGTVPDNNPEEALKSRLNEFMYFWAASDYPSMVNYCASDWKAKQENPLNALFAVLRNRTPLSFDFVAVSGESADKVRKVATIIQMDNHSGKAPRTYSIDYVMVQEDDGLWYVDPTSLATNEIPEATLVPELTPVPAAEITGDTILYYNPEGGSKYHLDPNCPSVNLRFIPLQGTFLYSDVNDPQYQELKPCRICNAPERQAGDNSTLAPADYTQKAWAFTAENYAELLNNPESIFNQPFCTKGMVQEVISEDPLIIVINTSLEENGEPQPVIIEGPEEGKFHWEKGCEYQIYGDFVSVRDGMPVLTARYSFTW